MTLVNERLKAKQIVDQDIYLNQSALVEKYLLDDSMDNDDITNQWITDETEGFTPEEIADNEHWQPKEVLEWHAVSYRLLNRLQAKGEVTLSNQYGLWWGRTTSGQAIYMDSVIEDIAEEVYSS